MGLNNRADRLLRLVLPLHESPHSADAWNMSLSGLSRLIGCEQVAILEREGPLVADAIAFGAGSDERFAEEYRTHFVHLDPFAREDRQALLTRSRRALHTDALVDPQVLHDSSFYNDYWKRWGIHGGLTSAVAITGRRHANFAALHAADHALDREDHSLFDLFVGHARAALRQRHALRMRDAALRGLLDSTDCLADAVFVIDGTGALIQSNAAADDLIARGDVVRLRGGELRLGRTAGNDPLADLLAEITGPVRSLRSAEPVRCLAIREGSASPDELLVTAVRTSASRQRGTPAAILFLRRAGDVRPVFLPQHLRDLFGFTPAESRVANALLAGERVEEIAARLSVRADTVRGHVKRMLAKSGTRKQADLVGRLASAVPTLRVFAPAA